MLHLNLADNALGPIGTGYICEMLKENCYITDLVSEFILQDLVPVNINDSFKVVVLAKILTRDFLQTPGDYYL